MNNNKKLKADAYYYIALDLMETGQIEASYDKLKSCLTIVPDDARYISALALNAFLLKRIDEAIKLYKKAIDIDPYMFNNYIYLSNIYELKEEFSLATEILERGLVTVNKKLSENPKNDYYLATKGNFHYYLREYDEATMAYYRALRINEKEPSYYRELANIFYEIEYYEETIKLAKKAITLNPMDHNSFLYIALAYQRLNLLGPAIVNLKRVIRLNPTQKEIRDLLRKLQELRKKNGPTIEEIIHTENPKRFYKGIVKWFDDEKGIGFLTTPSKKDEIFVHYTAIESEGYKTLYEGEQVNFGITKSPQGYIALKVKVLNRDPNRYKYGEVKYFDITTGYGEIRSYDDEVYPFHFSAINERLIKIVEVGESVRFEILENPSTLEKNAFNIFVIEKSEETLCGKILWFDIKTMNGVLESDDGMECIIQRNSFNEGLEHKLKKGVRVNFKIIQVENIDGNYIPKAINIKII